MATRKNPRQNNPRGVSPAPAATPPRAARRDTAPAADLAAPTGVALTWRRKLQLLLAGLWVLDGLLKLQPFMFTKDFAPMTLGEALDGAPGWLAAPIRWASGTEQRHSISAMAAFALIEFVVGFAIAWPRTAKLGLIACLVWVPFLWFFAEGLGGLASGSPSPFDAPGASILYALLAVLLWPAPDRDRPSSEAARFIGIRAAQAVWVVLWGLLAFLAFLPANTTPGTFSDAIAGNVEGAPSGYVWLLNHATKAVNGHGHVLGILLGVALTLVALSVLAPWARVVRAGIVLALVLAALIWVFAQGLGMPFQGMGTDPDTGPILALIALAYWPAVTRRAGEPGTDTAAIAAGAAA